jgi:hypothetical protein
MYIWTQKAYNQFHPSTKLSLAGNNLVIPTESLVSDIPAGNGKMDIFFNSVNILQYCKCYIYSVRFFE